MLLKLIMRSLSKPTCTPIAKEKVELYLWLSPKTKRPRKRNKNVVELSKMTHIELTGIFDRIFVVI